MTPQEFAANPCWRDSYFVDVFADDGKLIGTAELPAGVEIDPLPFVHRNVLFMHYRPIGDATDTSYVTLLRFDPNGDE